MAGMNIEKILAHLETFLKQLRLLIKKALFLKTTHASCYEIGHTWTPYCSQAALDVFLAALNHSFKIYSSVYLVTALVRRRKLDYYLEVVWKDILRSTVFLTTNAVTFIVAFCGWRKVVGFYFYANVLVCAIPINACLIQIEKKSRHGMLAMYTTNLALEILYTVLRSKGLVPRVPAGEVLIFSAGLAGFLHFFRKPQTVDGFTNTILSTIFGTDEVQDANPSVPSPHMTKLHSLLPTQIKQLIAQLLTNRILRAKHDKCNHKWGCISNILEKYIRCLGMGFGLGVVLKTPSSLAMIFSRKNPLYHWILNKDNLTIGSFLATMSTLHQGVSCALRWIRGDTDPNTDGLIAGAVAGISMLQYRSSSIALYILIRLVDLLCRKKVEEGKLPRLKNAYIYLYAISTGMLFHAAFWEPHNIRPGYWKFMLLLTGQKFKLVNRQLLDKAFGGASATLYPNFWPDYDPKFSSMTSAAKVLQNISKYTAK